MYANVLPYSWDAQLPCYSMGTQLAISNISSTGTQLINTSCEEKYQNSPIRRLTLHSKMNTHYKNTALSPSTLLEVIKIQTEIARMGLDLGAVMQLVTQQTQELTKAAGAIVEFAEGEEMVYRAAAGIAEPQLGLRLKRFGSLSGQCVHEGQILRCDDSESDPRVDREACRKVGLRSMIVVPLKHNDATVGVLKVVSPSTNAFSDDDIQLLGLMSELIASAMFHAVKYESNELYYRATHDSLTGLANRALFFDRLRLSLAQGSRHGDQMGILSIDMDGLKPINDLLGHRAGDAALKEVGARLSDACRKNDTVARVGGDEFGIILSRVNGRGNAKEKCLQLTEKISLPFQFEDRVLNLGASIGLALYPEDGNSIDELIESADQSMYENKRERKLGKI